MLPQFPFDKSSIRYYSKIGGSYFRRQTKFLSGLPYNPNELINLDEQIEDWNKNMERRLKGLPDQTMIHNVSDN